MSGFPQGHALLIQIAAYRNVTSLPSVDDAASIASVLVDPAGGGYPRGQVRLVVDEEATRSSVFDRLVDLAERTSAEDTALVYFSGHGGTIPTGRHAGEYLLPVDARQDGGRLRASTAISGSELTDAIRAVPAGRVLVVLDCCHAGGIGQPRGGADGPLGEGVPGNDVDDAAFETGLPEHFQQVLASGRGRVVLTSSRADELSWVEPGARHGLFTEHLVQGLRGGAAAEDGFVRVFDLFEYVQPRVTATRASQHPVFKGDLENNFALTARGHAPVTSGTDDPAYRYDAYVSYAEADETWVREELVSRLEAAGLTIAVSRDVEQLGVARVVSIERGMRQAKRTIVVLSAAYLRDTVLTFENVLAQTMGMTDGQYRLIPLRIGDLGDAELPERLSMLGTLDLAAQRDRERAYARLVETLQGPVPAM